jgi:acyl dehydratase
MINHNRQNPGSNPGFYRTKFYKMIKIGNKKYLEIKDYAKAKGVTIQTVYNWIKDKAVNERKLMGKTLIEL